MPPSPLAVTHPLPPFHFPLHPLPQCSRLRALHTKNACRYRSCLLGPGIVHRLPKPALSHPQWAGVDPAVAGVFLSGCRRLGVRFTTEAGPGPVVFDAPEGDGLLASHVPSGRSLVYDLLVSGVVTHRVACCSPKAPAAGA
jgi:hypothetical protein